MDSVIAACPSCNSKNKLPAERLADGPTCGRCKAKLFPAEPVAATDANFGDQVEGSPIPVLVDFWAPWCGPCRAFAPTFERYAAEHAGKVKCVKVNVDENPRVASRFGIRSIPTLMLFRDGEAVNQVAGAMPGDALTGWVDQTL